MLSYIFSGLTRQFISKPNVTKKLTLKMVRTGMKVAHRAVVDEQRNFISGTQTEYATLMNQRNHYRNALNGIYDIPHHEIRFADGSRFTLQYQFRLGMGFILKRDLLFDTPLMDKLGENMGWESVGVKTATKSPKSYSKVITAKHDPNGLLNIVNGGTKVFLWIMLFLTIIAGVFEVFCCLVMHMFRTLRDFLRGV